MVYGGEGYTSRPAACDTAPDVYVLDVNNLCWTHVRTCAAIPGGHPSTRALHLSTVSCWARQPGNHGHLSHRVAGRAQAAVLDAVSCAGAVCGRLLYCVALLCASSCWAVLCRVLGQCAGSCSALLSVCSSCTLLEGAVGSAEATMHL